MHFAAPTGEVVIQVRSASDPFYLASTLTDCTMDFFYEPPKKHNAWLQDHHSDVLPAFLVLALSLAATAVCICARRPPKVDYAPLLKDTGAYGGQYGAAESSIEFAVSHPKGA